MKKLFPFLFLFISTLTCYSQETEAVKENVSKTKAFEFSSKAGSLIQEKKYFMSDINPEAKIKGVFFYISCYENLFTKEKVASLRITATTYSGLIRSVEVASGILDADEVTKCLESLIYIQQNIIGQTPIEPTDCFYVSKDLVRIGVTTIAKSATAKREWVPTIIVDRWKPENVANIKLDDFNKLILNLTIAKSKIEELVR